MTIQEIENYLHKQKIYSYFMENSFVCPDVVELPLLPKDVCKKRKAEFINGRFCARKALSKMGVEFDDLIRIGSDGEPVFPDSISGSISHSRNYFTACVSKKEDYVSLGIDIEEIKRGISDKAFKLIATDEEIEIIKKCNVNKLKLKLILFSLKEAIIKALYPVLSRKIFFTDICFPDIYFKEDFFDNVFLFPSISDNFNVLLTDYYISATYFLTDDFVFSLAKVKWQRIKPLIHTNEL